jgi:hypothetical protein
MVDDLSVQSGESAKQGAARLDLTGGGALTGWGGPCRGCSEGAEQPQGDRD